MKTNELTVVIADDHPIFREGLAGVVARQDGWTVVGEAPDGAGALALVKSQRVDVAVLDVDMPEMDGIETARAIRTESPSTKIVFLTMHKERSIVRSMAKLGVRGYVLKDSAMGEIVDCIKAVAAGKTYLSPSLSDLMLSTVEFGSDAALTAVISELTSAEKKVLRLIADSGTSREIAKTLFVSIRTVEKHRYNICQKLGLSGPHALVRFALDNREVLDRKLIPK